MVADGYEKTDRTGDRGHNFGGNFIQAKTKEEEALKKAKTTTITKQKNTKPTKLGKEVGNPPGESMEDRVSRRKEGYAVSNLIRRIKK